jgi:peptidoglycan hydrolase-like protein with peptidoglycan-binding domain
MFSAALIASPVLASTVQQKPASTHRATASTHRTATSTTAYGTHKAVRRHKRKPRGQLVIEPGRVTEIQQALIREHYLKGEANGEWDAATVAAMQKYQADHGWQTKLTPDSRALKMLGLGPDYSNAINAKDSSFGEPPPASTIPAGQSAGFAAAAGINR